MSGRNTTLTTGASQISQADLARLEQEQQLHAHQQRRAARVVAASSLNIDDCRLLLDILGLDRSVVQAAKSERLTPPAAPAAPATPAAPPTRRRRSRAA